jgi:hypothetical protein
MFRLMFFAIIRFLHDLFEVCMRKCYNGWAVLASSRESEGVLGHVVVMIFFFISKLMTKWIVLFYVLLLIATLVYCTRTARWNMLADFCKIPRITWMNSHSSILIFIQADRMTEMAKKRAEISQFFIKRAPSSLCDVTGRRHQRRDAPRTLQECWINLSEVWYSFCNQWPPRPLFRVLAMGGDYSAIHAVSN